MATVTGYTAERMKNIEDNTVTDGEVQGDNLVLFQRDGSVIQAGNVRGPKGDQGAQGPTLPAGTIVQWAGGGTPPSKWLVCDGAAISRATFSLLFAAIGITWGVGDNSTTFNLPNLKGRVPVGLDSGQPEFNAQGKTGGAKTHTLIIAELPSHNHTTPDHNHTFTARHYDYGANPASGGSTTALGSNASSAVSTNLGGNSGGSSSGLIGNNTPHNNLQPYVTVGYIISTGGE